MIVIVKNFRYGTVDKDGKLDYHVYCENEEQIDEHLCASHLMKAQILGEHDINASAHEIWEAVGEDARRLMSKMFRSPKHGKRPNLVLSEVGDAKDAENSWIVVMYNCAGPWPAIYKRKDVDYNNLLTFKDSSTTYAMWDNERWYHHKDDGNDIPDDLKRKFRIWP